MAHRNAKLTLPGKLVLVDRVLREGMSVAQASYMLGVSRATGFKWMRRFKECGIAGLEEKSSKPDSSPRAFSEALRDEICELRRTGGRGPLHIAWRFGISCSVVHKILSKRGISRLAWMDRTTREVVRYEHEHPGDLLHLDVKKLWRIPPGGGRFTELTREGGASISRAGKRGWGTTSSMWRSTTSAVGSTSRFFPTRRRERRSASSIARWSTSGSSASRSGVS